MLQDRFGRTIEYVRLSVTDRCDFRCVYCMNEQMTFLPKARILTLEEMALNGFLQLNLSDMKFIRCDVSVIHRHDIRIAFYGESQLIECLGILI